MNEYSNTTKNKQTSKCLNTNPNFKRRETHLTGSKKKTRRCTDKPLISKGLGRPMPFKAKIVDYQRLTSTTTAFATRILERLDSGRAIWMKTCRPCRRVASIPQLKGRTRNKSSWTLFRRRGRSWRISPTLWTTNLRSCSLLSTTKT